MPSALPGPLAKIGCVGSHNANILFFILKFVIKKAYRGQNKIIKKPNIQKLPEEGSLLVMVS